jgi:hypothetical protein
MFRICLPAMHTNSITDRALIWFCASAEWASRTGLTVVCLVGFELLDLCELPGSVGGLPSLTILD